MCVSEVNRDVKDNNSWSSVFLIQLSAYLVGGLFFVVAGWLGFNPVNAGVTSLIVILYCAEIFVVFWLIVALVEMYQNRKKSKEREIKSETTLK